MRWTSSASRRTERKARVETPGRPRRLTLEPLEDRTLLDAALANLVDERLATLQTGLAGVVRTTAELPFLNSKMDAIAGDADKALTELRDRIRPVLTAFNAAGTDTALKQSLHAALSARGLLHDAGRNGTTFDDVSVARDATGTLTVTLNLGREVLAKGFTFGLGLPGVPLRVDAGGLEVGATAFYDGLGVRISPAGTPTFDASTPDVAGAEVSARFKSGVEIKGSLGFLAVSARPVGTNELWARLTTDVTGTGLAAPRLTGGAEANIKITADFNAANLQPDDEGEYPPYPRIATTLHFDWNLDGSDPLAGRESLGQEPTIEFRNVTLNLGTYLSSVLGPVASTIRDFMRPMDPILKIITTEIPGLSDLSKEIGAGPITLKTLAKIAGGTGQLPPDYQLLLDLFDATTSLHELLIQVDPSSPTLEFDVGTFSLAGNNIRGKTLNPGGLSAENLTDLIPVAVGTLRSVNDQLRASTPDVLKPVFNVIDQRLRSADQGAGFQFPLFDDPMQGVFKLLLGRDVDFVNYTAKFHFDAYKTELLPLPIPILPDIIKVRLNGQIDVDAYLKVGYDTYGLRQFLRNGLKNPAHLLNGLYFDASRPLLTMNGSVSVGLAAGFIPPVLVPVGPVPVPVQPNVSINGELSARDVKVSFGVSKAEFRVLEDDPDPLFNTEGLIKAGFTFVAEAGVPGLPALELYKRVLSERVLFDLYNGTLANPGNPFVKQKEKEEKPGPVIVDLNRPQPGFPIFVKGPGNNGFPDVIEVSSRNGFLTVFVNGIYVLEEPRPLGGVSRVIIIGSEDDDALTVDGRIDKPVEFRGGLGTNALTLDDRGTGLSGRTYSPYTVTRNVLSRQTRDNTTDVLYGTVRVDHKQVTALTLYTSALTDGTQVAVRDLFNNSVNVTLGQTDNTVTIDTTTGGFADRVTLDWRGLPFGEPGINKLVVTDRVGANQLHGRGTFELTRDRLTRRKLMPLKFGSLGLRGGTGTATIDFAGINLAELSVRGGDQGYDFDVQSTREGTRYNLTGGAGADTFTLGQLHRDLPGGTGQERQLGFAAANVAIDGGGSAGDRLVLDDSGSDYVLYGVRNTYDVTASQVRLESVQDFPESQKVVNSTFDYKRIENLVLKTGGRNEVNVRETMRSQGFVGVVKTEILGGRGDDSVRVLSTRTPLVVSLGGGTNQVGIGTGTGGEASLDGIGADVRITGPFPGAINAVALLDTDNDLGYTYTLTPDRFTRTGIADVIFDGVVLSRLIVRAGHGGNVFDIDGTPIPPSGPNLGAIVFTGDGDDRVNVRATGGPLSLDLAGGTRQSLAVGDATHSLDLIRGDVTVFGAGEIDATFTDTAAADSHYVTLDSNVFEELTLSRQAIAGEQPAQPRRFLFASPGRLNLNYLAARGGDVFFVNAVRANAAVSLVGGAGGRDIFAVGFGADANRIQGGVAAYGQAADGDFAYYYDFLNPSPQTYDITSAFLSDQGVIFWRSGAAPVGYYGLSQVILYTPAVGGSTVNVAALPAQTLLNMAVGDGDRVTLGGGPGTGGLTDIRGPVSVGPNTVGAAATVILDDSGNATTGRDASVTSADYDGTRLGTVEGLAPGRVVFRDQENYAIGIRGGGGDDRFRIAGEPAAARVSLDGGGGVNTLDYLGLWDRSVTPAEDGAVVNLALGTATGLRGGIAGIRNVVGSSGNDILVGNGGNILDGGAGRDILIAGRASGVLLGGAGEDLLIAGTTAYDLDPLALARIHAEWTRTDIDYDARYRNLTTDNGTPVPKLTAQTVTGNGGGNVLFGGADTSDLFFASIDLDPADAGEGEWLFGI